MTQLPDILDQAPGAFVRALLEGQLLEAEHQVRYQWLAQAVKGKRVLDAGCGLATGAHLLAAAGAQEVVGIDDRSPLLEAAKDDHPALRLEEATLGAAAGRDSSLESLGSFDVIAAFGVLERCQRPRQALDELLGLLAPGGIVAVSISPFADTPAIEAGNSKATLASSSNSAEPLLRIVRQSIAVACTHHMVVHQRNWMTSAILDEQIATNSEAAPLEGIEWRKIVAAAPDSAVATLIVGSQAPVPSMHGTSLITHEFAERRWMAHCQQLERQLHELDRLEQALRDAHRERQMLAERVITLERQQATANSDASDRPQPDC